MWTVFIPFVAVILIVGCAVFYIVREKKKGNKCIGCPYSSSCDKRGCQSERDSAE